jgi:ribose transport system permease protein
MNRLASGSSLARLFARWGLLIILIAITAAFAIALPATFPTAFNIESTLNNKSVSALLALAVLIPMTAAQFDMSAGFNLGLSQVLAIGLQAQGLSWPAACAVVLIFGAATGLANGVLITYFGIDSFIATLGTGSIIYGFNQWYTGGQQIVFTMPASFLSISGIVSDAAPIPLAAIYVAVISLGLWLLFEFRPFGRKLYALGFNPRAAALNGISAKTNITVAFVLAGVLASFAGIVLQAQLQVGQSALGQEYLLPAFSSALLGATSVHPGRVNVWGTILAVLILSVAVDGLNLLGAPFFIEPLFNGVMLLLAVGLAVAAVRRRGARIRQQADEDMPSQAQPPAQAWTSAPDHLAQAAGGVGAPPGD